MRDFTQTVDELRETRDELARRGIDDLARAVDRAIEDLSTPTPSSTNDLVTTGEAARLLGVRSVNTIKRWVADGILEGYRRGSRILVARASIDRMLSDPRLARYQTRQQELDDVLALFDAGDEPLPPSDVLWEGRKPWEVQGAEADRSRGR
jgi:excisionase family DNA binding protein